MSDKSDLVQARSDMLAVLDEKLSSMPEWRALRAMDRAVAAMEGRESPGPAAPVHSASAAKPRKSRTRKSRSKKATGVSYVGLGLEALAKAGQPLSTDKMMEFIGSKRTLSGDPKRVRINVQSSFSK